MISPPAKYAGSYNVGPSDEDCCQTGELVDLMVINRISPDKLQAPVPERHRLLIPYSYPNLIIANFFCHVGPSDEDCCQTGELVDLFVNKWGEGIKWISQKDDGKDA